ncbi:PucR family transcriptional regulator [Streptomyces rapamycinicus]|uniref:Transcriptional regulator n=2 Tax=Streptomyces rapamycinicus TaxID=1226757 RepID=A0A0A0NWZ1_STRRN|nr:PucR family transcriptional regulator [Streptomyces rapamycinicus]AGP60620.1 transcriptional regulator [Streptomyces rapamycinicus NRRL 5491]MBB4788212.1 purine catabolism regulator [Streptomyces rapamycinicus]RLV72547.1 transcriptional regulator [Streptomyces rapamycinicus NRRL 5491]UTP36174.1 PucR family transcriptional regulator [Streptomyces rapamycinicus NRRL 5491]
MVNNKEQGVTVDDLLSYPALQLRLIAGGAGLHRSVSWAHVSELDDPTPWLLGSEMIMTTGIAMPRSAAGQRAYLERLDDAGVAALAVSAQLRMPPLRRAFFDAAEERGIPVLEIPLAVPFMAVAQEVAAAVQEDARHRLGAQLQVFGALRWLTSENLDTATLFGRLEKLSGYDIYLCTTQGRPLLPGVPAPDASVIPGSADAPPTIPGGFALPVPSPGGPAGFLIAFEREGARPAGLAVVQHIATVAALQLAMVRTERETLRREGAEILAELLQGALEPAVARRHLLRHSIEGETVLAVVRGVTEDVVLRALEDQPCLLLKRGEDRYLLGSPGLGEAVESLPGVAAGMSRPFSPGSPLRIAQREALWAASHAVASGRALVRYGDDVTGRWLPDDPAALTDLVEHVLGEALRYDTGHGSRLLTSVRTWMERDRRTDEAAAALHVHPNTLAYRLRRFSELTGRDLSTTGAFAEVWLAIRAASQLGLLD